VHLYFIILLSKGQRIQAEYSGKEQDCNLFLIRLLNLDLVQQVELFLDVMVLVERRNGEPCWEEDLKHLQEYDH